jgi:hypothetical protein
LEIKDEDTSLLETDLQDGQFVTGGIRLRI